MNDLEQSSTLWVNLLRVSIAGMVALLSFIGYQAWTIRSLRADIVKEYNYIHKGQNSMSVTSLAIQKLHYEIDQAPDSVGAVENLIDDLCKKYGLKFRSRSHLEPERVSNLVQENGAKYDFGAESKNKLLPMLKELEDSKKGLTVSTLEMVEFNRDSDSPRSISLVIHWYSPIDQ